MDTEEEKKMMRLPICPFCVMGKLTHCNEGIPLAHGNYNTIINGKEKARCLAWVNGKCKRL